MTANPERGEVEIELDGKAYVLRPSWEALKAIESQSGKTVLQLSWSVANWRSGGIFLHEIGMVLREGMRAAAPDDKMIQAYSADVLSQMAYRNYLGTMMALDRFFMNGLNGGKESEKKTGESQSTQSPTVA